jgi:hypothetical protein
MKLKLNLHKQAQVDLPMMSEVAMFRQALNGFHPISVFEEIPPRCIPEELRSGQLQSWQW